MTNDNLLRKKGEKKSQEGQAFGEIVGFTPVPPLTGHQSPA
jgi:hypothetical protein